MTKRLVLALASALLLSPAYAHNFYAGIGAGATNFNKSSLNHVLPA